MTWYACTIVNRTNPSIPATHSKEWILLNQWKVYGAKCYIADTNNKYTIIKI